MDSDRVAPGRLELVRHVLNSDDRYHQVDYAGSVEILNQYLARLDGTHPISDVHDLATFRSFREAIRSLLLRPGPTAAEHVNRFAEHSSLIVQMNHEGTSMLRPTPAARSTPLAMLIADVVAAVHDSMLEDRWRRLHACRRFDCGWIYYDGSSKNSGRWCSTDPCGNVMKTRAYRARKQRALISSNSD